MGLRNLQRGQLLQAEAARRATMNQGIALGGASDEPSCNQCRLVIGQCSCNGNVSMASANPRGIPQGGGGNLVGYPQTAVAVPDNAGGWTVVPPVADGCFPRKLCDTYGRPMGWGRAMAEVMARGKAEPYVDPIYDFANMDVLYSEFITALPGVAINIDVSPEQGTFAGFYYSVVAVDPTTQVEQVDWQIVRPAVVGCPSPCSTAGPILPSFVRRSPDGCCGIPLSAFLDRRSETVPLRASFLNNQAAGNLLVQMEVRGYCCSTRIC